MRPRTNQLDAASVRQVLETVVDEHAKAGFDQLASCASAWLASPVPGFNSNEYDERMHRISSGFGKLHEMGGDQLAILLARCHRHGIAQKAKFYAENPDLRLDGYPSGLVYKHERVCARVSPVHRESARSLRRRGD